MLISEPTNLVVPVYKRSTISLSRCYKTVDQTVVKGSLESEIGFSKSQGNYRRTFKLLTIFRMLLCTEAERCKNDQSSCFWPGNHHYATAFKNLTKPSDKWKVCPIKLKFVSDNLSEIRSTRDNFLDTSDIDSVSHTNPLRRRSKAVASRRESTDSDSGENTVASNILPEAPDIQFEMPESNPDESPRGSVFMDVNIPLLMVDEVEAIADGQQTRLQIKKPKSLERQMLYKIEELIQGCPKLPITTLEELQACNTYILHDENHLQFLMNLVSTVGGVSIKATERVLSKILKNKVAAGFNWCGIVKTNVKPKTPLKDFEGILNLLFGSVRKIISTASDKDVETWGKYWLRHAKGRCTSKTSKPELRS
ncbi:unnamed protein product [Allacma fusca]|uniref:DUF4806 domain-containing protein n=1 Tax=Allacma fusca TaxID=39272 RepID=A0A8J2PP53_9HEXA|nr:unnamed protein product [Allacma fusca]